MYRNTNITSEHPTLFAMYIIHA